MMFHDSRPGSELTRRAVVAGSGIEHREVRAPGGSGLAELMWLIMVGDATSVYLGLARGADPAPIEAIHRVKRAIEERRG